MSIPDTSIDPRISDCAKREFLQKGYQKASLRDICKKAGVTTGAFYKRFKGKEELFSALVEPMIQCYFAIGDDALKRNQDAYEQDQMQGIWDMSEETYKKWMRSFYEEFDSLKLLLCCANGSKYENFLHDVVTENTTASLRFAQLFKDSGKIDAIPDEDELHIVLTAYWTCLFEPIIHDFPLEKALKYCGTIAKLFNWQLLFGF